MKHFDLIRHWAEERNLIKGSAPHIQMTKTVEELGELASGISKHNRDAVIDSVGDVVVCLTIIAAQLDLKIEDCIDFAWHQIKDRKGRMIDGVFVKEEDLPVQTSIDLDGDDDGRVYMDFGEATDELNWLASHLTPVQRSYIAYAEGHSGLHIVQHIRRAASVATLRDRLKLVEDCQLYAGLLQLTDLGMELRKFLLHGRHSYPFMHSSQRAAGE